MVVLKTPEQLQYMKRAGEITAHALLKARDAIRVGISTAELDKIIRAYIERCGATPSFLGYGGFPASACISLNHQVIHGIPSPQVCLREGDIVKVDVGACYRGYHGDSARTFAVGRISAAAQRLIEVTEQCFRRGVAKARPGNRLGDIGASVQSHAESNGFSVVRTFVGHGVGSALHEPPDVPNYGTPGRGTRLYAAMTLAIEPMINEGTPDVRVLDDGWTVLTADGKLSAHYEHTVAITPEGPWLLTDVGE
ncbi:MAG: type I methionyl aminopeptidase [Eubacteriales bacterium]